jgi:choline transport protein
MADNYNDEKLEPITASSEDTHSEALVNASGHRQELQRNFSLLSICALAVTTGNTWIAQGGSVVSNTYVHCIIING